ncbi:glycosyltransferase family 2 protein [Nocardioides sp. 503]|uniref:glycosyltransferase family 2 protein n=1 Tax=Nocardioides sp. 503 TaxID=2508326 RepID=UPI00106F41E0|nr:glycosyltransferase family 2 protein [Nocardioides sp. 503]
MSQPVDVVVVTYNSAATIGPLLDSLPAAAGALSYRTTIVDNASVDATPAVVARRADAQLVPAPNDGYAAGLNRGVAAAGGSGPILMLNPDCVLEPGCVERLVEAQEETGAGVVVPQVLDQDGATARSLRREPSLPRSVGFGESRWPLLSEVVTDDAAYARRHPVDWATGAVMLVSRDCYDALGGLDESFFMYSEETDLCLRARDLGLLTVVEPRALAMHLGAASGQSPELYAMQAVNRVRLYRRRHGAAASLLFLMLAVAREAGRALAGDPEARRALESLVRRSRRPAQLPWTGSILRRSSPDRSLTSA